MSQQPAYGEVHGPRAGEITRRGFMRRMVGWGVGLLSVEFLAGTFAFLWPNLTEGLGAEIRIGSAQDILSANPEWSSGLPYIYQAANLFVVNVPAAKARVDGGGTVASPIEDPGTDLSEELPLAERSVLTMWRKCPHLGCLVPQLCDQSQWFECLCHGSKYTVLGEKRDGPAPRGLDRFAMTLNEEGVYVVDTREVIDGPPVGTATFDPRAPTEMTHCAG